MFTVHETKAQIRYTENAQIRKRKNRKKTTTKANHIRFVGTSNLDNQNNNNNKLMSLSLSLVRFDVPLNT